MKLLFTTLIAGLCLSSTNLAGQAFSVNINGAPQFSFIRNKSDKNNPAVDKRSTPNMRFGLGAGYHFTKNLGIGTDFYYSWQGQRYKVSGQERKQKINYLKVPIVFVYNTDPSRLLSFVAKAGPQLSFLTGSKLEDGNDQDVIADTDSRYRKATVGSTVQAGTQFKLSSKCYLESSLWFDNDFTNAEDEDAPSYPAGRTNSYNMTIGLQVQLKYMLR